MSVLTCEHKRQVCSETEYEWAGWDAQSFAVTPRKCKDCGEQLPPMRSVAFDYDKGFYAIDGTLIRRGYAKEVYDRYQAQLKEEDGSTT